MKVTTTSKNCDKVNDIVPIVQEHSGPVMNMARIKLLEFVADSSFLNLHGTYIRARQASNPDGQLTPDNLQTQKFP